MQTSSVASVAANANANPGLVANPAPEIPDFMEVVGWQWRYLDSEDGPPGWHNSTEQFAKAVSRYSSHEIRPVYARKA
jgi:hypothetical protein